MQWNVFYEDFNKKEIKKFNIFDHFFFVEWLKKEGAPFIDDRDKFLSIVRSNLRYYFGYKCEWEIVLTSWPPNEKFEGKKVDVFIQVDMNWPQFADYVWNHRAELFDEGVVDDGK